MNLTKATSGGICLERKVGTRVGVIFGTGEGASEDDPHRAENEIARLYWKLFASTRMALEGKVWRRVEYMPFADRLGS